MHLRRKLAQLVSDHVLCYPHIVVDLAVVHLEDQADEIGQDGRAAGLRLDRGRALAGFRSHYRETMVRGSCQDWSGLRRRGGLLDRAVSGGIHGACTVYTWLAGEVVVVDGCTYGTI